MGDGRKRPLRQKNYDSVLKRLSAGISGWVFDKRPGRRRSLLQWILAAALAAAVIGIVLAGIFFSGDTKDKAARAVFDIVSEAADLEVKDFRYSQVGDPDFQWEVRAERAWYRKKDEEVHLDTVSVRLVSADGKIYRMTGDRGVLNSESGDMALSGGVEVISDEGERLTTDALQYRSKDRVVYTEDPVEMYRNTMDLSGRGMTFALEGNELVLFSEVKAVIADASLFD